MIGDSEAQLSALLARIEAETGVSLDFGAEDMAVLRHESGVDVVLTADHQSGMLRIGTALAQVDTISRETLFRDLLMMNFLTSLYGPFHLALNGDGSHVMLLAREAIADLSPMRFGQRVSQILVATADLRPKLAIDQSSGDGFGLPHQTETMGLLTPTRGQYIP